MDLENIFINNTNLPYDIINTIIKFTRCECDKKKKIKKKNTMILFQTRCKKCNNIDVFSKKYLPCTVCKTKNHQYKKCIICHQCLVDMDTRVNRCYDCNRVSVRFNS